jgi:hypothetical protein
MRIERSITMVKCMQVAWLIAATTIFGPITLFGTPAHEDGVLTVANREFAPGDSLQVTGEKFGARNRLTLVLEGLAGRVELGTVTADAGGTFATRVRVPTGLDDGSYRLLALATDGDEAASLDVIVLARTGHTASAAGDAEDTHGMEEPSREPLVLGRARSPWVTGGAGSVAVLALAFGVVLLRRPAGSRED